MSTARDKFMPSDRVKKKIMRKFSRVKNVQTNVSDYKESSTVNRIDNKY